MLIPQEHVEAVMQFSILFWTERPKDANLESTAVAQFSGVLGFHPEEHAFQRAYNYTPLPSALIWTGRALLVEYALPLERQKPRRGGRSLPVCLRCRSYLEN